MAKRRSGYQEGARIRLEVECPNCQRPRRFVLKDVYDTGPLFECPVCALEWHLHLEQMIPFAKADQESLGHAVPTYLIEGRVLLPVSDRRPEEAMASLRDGRARALAG